MAEARPGTDTTTPPPYAPREAKAVMAGGTIGVLSFYAIAYATGWECIPSTWWNALVMLALFTGSNTASVIHHRPSPKLAVAMIASPVVVTAFVVLCINPLFERYPGTMLMTIGLTFGFVLPVLFVAGKIK